MHGESVTVEAARAFLKDVDPMWRAFWFHMHLVAKNLEEFAAGLTQISDEVFAYHVSGQKNDLAKWVQEVVGDSALAALLATVASKEEAARQVADRVAMLKSALQNG
jgi:phosphate uptake regulator